jgi:ATP-binding cassette subfamily B protein
LLAFAAFPLWCNRRGRALVNAAETESAEDFRLQRHLFDLATSAAGGKELRVSGAAAEVTRRQGDAWDAVVTARFRARLRATGWRLTGWAGFTLGFLVALVAVIHAAATGSASAGDLVLAVTVAATLESAVQMAVTSTSEALEAERLVEPYLWLRAYAAEERQRVTATLTPPDVLHEGIVLDDVGYTYPGASRPALEELSVRIPAGSVVAIVGEYGSGKTTLVKLLGKFYRPSTGMIRIDATDLADLDTELWRARTSAAYQDFGRYPQMTFAESVGLGDLPHLDDHEVIEESVRAADATTLTKRLPEGLNTPLGRVFGGVELSEGQWQKTALARASMRPDPLLFVLDEPTASLDAPSEHAVFERYMDRARLLAKRTGAITVIVSHRFSTVTGADTILVLHQGRLVEHGTHEELLADAGTYGDLYGIQADAYALGGRTVAHHTAVPAASGERHVRGERSAPGEG